jgi:hypothetical protein
MSLTGLFNLVSGISQGTDLEEYLARRNEYVDLFGGELRGRFGACQRGPAGVVFSPDFQGRLMREAQRRERKRAEVPESLRQKAAFEAARALRLAFSAMTGMAAEFGVYPRESARHRDN